MQIIRGDEIEFTPASHEPANDPGVLKRVLFSKNELLTGQVQMVNWAKLPVGKAFQRHYHEDMQEIFVICEGEVEVEVDGQTARLRKGDAILIESREVHRMTNSGEKEAQYVVFGIASGKGGQTVVCG